MKTTILAALSLIVAGAGFDAFATNPSVVLTPDRGGHTGTLLNDGRVLIAGGVNENADLNSALVYDYTTNTLTPTGSLVTARENHTATKLLDGRVLITGGDLLSGETLKSAEIYDPATGTFAFTAHAMSIRRSKHTATLLEDGKVLIEGGKNADLFDPVTEIFTPLPSDPPYTNRSSESAVRLADGTVLITGGYVGTVASFTGEIYDPATQTFLALPTDSRMQIGRANHDSTLLFDGRVLITGGFTGTSPQDEVDLYDPSTQTFLKTAAMLEHRSNHRNVLLPDGDVLVVGGTTLESGFLAVNEIYHPAADPKDGTWTVADPVMNENRSGVSAILLPNATVFVAGGITGSNTLQSAEILDPVFHTFTPLPPMTVGRNQHTATLLPSGKVLLAGGSLDADFLNSSEIFDPVSNTFTASGTMIQARKSHTATLLADNNRVLIAGGKTSNGDSVRAEVFDISLGSFQRVGDMSTGRSLFTATLLDDGKVLVSAGRSGNSPTPTAELFDPVANTFSDTGMLNLKRKRHDATKLPDGTVFISGGAANENSSGGGDPGTDTCEIYDPLLGTFSYTENNMVMTVMIHGRTEHQATLLANGKVVIVGGNLVPNEAESDLYNPADETFMTVGNLLQQRLRHIDILLANSNWGSDMNKVLVIGGASTGSGAFGGLEQALASVELYDPDNGQFTFFGNMTEPRQNHTATMLNDGRILIAGGVGSPAFSGTGEILTTDVSPTPTPTPTPTPPGQMGNISTRLSVGTGDDVLIGGIIITGTVAKEVIVRGIGPSLGSIFPDALRDPYLEIHDSGGKLIASNDNWQDGDKTAILATGLAPTEKKESAVVLTLDPGAYTAILSGVGGTTGVGLVEFYDLAPTVPAELANISTRGFVQTGDNVMILGTIVLGDSATNVLFRALGPSLSAPSLPIPDALQDPTLELHDSNGNVIAYNDNWRSDQEAEIIATTNPPSNDAESAIVATLNPGVGYTVIVRGANGTTGLALAEAYQLQK